MAKRPPSGKPYPTFPLFRHASGQWAKKVAGKTRYFGTEWRGALKQWDKDKDCFMRAASLGRRMESLSAIFVTAFWPASGY